MKAVIQGLLIGQRLCEFERLSICSFLANGHERSQEPRGSPQNRPVGVTSKPAS